MNIGQLKKLIEDKPDDMAIILVNQVGAGNDSDVEIMGFGNVYEDKESGISYTKVSAKMEFSVEEISEKIEIKTGLLIYE